MSDLYDHYEGTNNTITTNTRHDRVLRGPWWDRRRVESYDQLQHWMHVGGDEVDLQCWTNSEKVQEWMREHNMSNVQELLVHFEKDLLNYVIHDIKKRPMVWQEIFDSGVALPSSTIIDIWKVWEYQTTRTSATAAGFDVVQSACWYLDYLHVDWDEFYDCDPSDFEGTYEQRFVRVLGGHAAMWAENIDSTNFMMRVWPRTSAMAERLWTSRQNSQAVQNRYDRMNRFRCLIIRQLHVPVSPTGPGTCEGVVR